MDESDSAVRVMIVGDEQDTRRHLAAAILGESRTKLVAKASTAREAIAAGA
jgi:hypothetical protein